MFDSQVEILNSGRVHKHHITQNGEPLPFSGVLHLWQCDEPFRRFFISLLANAPFAAFRWETPPVTTEHVNRTFEFVILDSPWLAVDPDRISFAEHFGARAAESSVVTFENLGRDALLVVPSPKAPDSDYAHLAAFTRHAPQSQQNALWQTVGKSVVERIDTRPLWLSTAGGGVAWLHVRLDSYPKYYGYWPYTVFR